MRTGSVSSVFLLVLALSHSASVGAMCKSKTIFSCTTAKGKTAEVCDSGSKIEYSFGKKDAASEISLAIPRANASTYQWDGIGRSMLYSVQIPVGKTVYEVFRLADKISQEVTFGINVVVDGKPAATLTCKPETVTDNIEGVALRPAS
jgi:hypothetical protein